MRNIQSEILAELRMGYEVTVEYIPMFGPAVTFEHQPVGWGGFPFQQRPGKNLELVKLPDKLIGGN